jgi:hypothetical protein
MSACDLAQVSEPQSESPWLGIPAGLVLVGVGLLTIQKARNVKGKYGDDPPPLKSILRHTAFGWEREQPRGAIVIGAIEMAIGAFVVLMSGLALLGVL